MTANKNELSVEQREELIKVLQARFEKNMNRHEGLEWAKVEAKIEANAEKLWSLNEMEVTGGEPDVVDMTKRRTSILSMIVQRRVLKVVEAFVMILKR